MTTRIDADALARRMLTRHEGRRSHLYRCTSGYLTIGIGHNIEARGLPDFIIDLLFDFDLDAARRDLDQLVPEWREFDPVRRAALLDWAFQLGLPRMRPFAPTIAHMRRQEWDVVAARLRRTKWAKDTPARAARVIGMLESGVVPPDL